MDDNEILDLYFARSEQAIVQTDQKYGFYCYSIAKRILSEYLLTAPLFYQEQIP